MARPSFSAATRERIAATPCCGPRHRAGVSRHLGTRHRVEDDTLRALLGAMRVDAGTEDSIAAELLDLARARCRQCVPPMTVVRSDARPWRIAVHLAATRCVDVRLHGACRSESGIEPRDVVAAPPPAPARRSRRWRRALRRIRARHRRRTAARATTASNCFLQGSRWRAERWRSRRRRCYRPASLRGGGRRLGRCRAALRPALGAQLGHRRLHRSRDVRRAVGRRRRGRRRRQSAARARSRTIPAQASPYSPSSRLFLNVALSRRRGDPRIRATARERASVCRAAQFQAHRRCAARHRRSSTTPAWPRRSGRCSNCSTGTSRRDSARRSAVARARRSTRSAAARRRRCGATRCSRRCRSISSSGIPQSGAGPRGPRSYRDPRRAGDAALRRPARRAGRLLRIAAMAGRAAACERRRACASLRARRRALQRSRGVDRSRRRRGLGAAGPVRARRKRRRAARRVQPEGPGLGPAAADPAAPARCRLRAVHRDAARQHAPRRRAAHRPRDGSAAPVLGPAGASAAQGAYVRYPFDDLLGVLALESQRNRCLVIGEDLGTVPDEVRAASPRATCSRTGCCSSSATPTATSSRRPTIPRQALRRRATHDLPTLAGWWEGRDLALRGAHRPARVPTRTPMRRWPSACATARLLLALWRAPGCCRGSAARPARLAATDAGARATRCRSISRARRRR